MFEIANPQGKYKQQGILTASPAELIVMLYNEAIKQLKLSRMAIASRNYESCNTRLQNVREILMELCNSLDFHYPIAKDLLEIYSFLIRKIIEINVVKDADMIEPVLGILADLREAWVQTAKATKNVKKPMLEESL